MTLSAWMRDGGREGEGGEGLPVVLHFRHPPQKADPHAI